MAEARTSQTWKLLGLAMLAGWLVGKLWWVGLVIVLECENGIGSRVASLVAHAPLMAIPWAVVGLVIGAVTLAVRSPWVPVAAALGATGGGVYILATSPLDTWLAMTMPMFCLGGALAGTVAGAVGTLAWRAG